MKKNIIILSLSWFIIIFLSCIWSIYYSKYKNEKIYLNAGRDYFELIVLVRRWNSLNKRVYVPISEFTQPNPYLKIKDRDIYFKNLNLTMVNPAYMTRQISELSQFSKGIKIKTTSLNPINPINTPDKLEKQALIEFEKGKKEFYKILGNTFFYMAPLKVEKPCLQCHSSQKYKIGDVIGGISIKMKYLNAVPLFSLTFAHLIIGIIGLIFIFKFNRKLEKVYKKLEHQATHDTLTGIYNRREFNRRLFEEINRAKRLNYPLSIIMCDIDYFKKINDTYGHQQGDYVLKKVAEAIKNSIKRAGDICARYGGEEFIILLPNTDKNGALKIAKEIQKNIKNLNIDNKNAPSGKLTISIGIFTANDFENLTQDIIVQNADKALYKAKETGRDKIEIFK